MSTLTYTVDNTTYTVGDTVRCTHNDDGECQLCRERPSACGYLRIKQGGIGTIIDVNDDRLPWVRQQKPGDVHSIRVAFLGGDRPTIMPLNEIALVPNLPEEKLDMWQLEMDEVSKAGYEAMKAYDRAKDGTPAKRQAMDEMDYINMRRRLIERVFEILVP